MDETNELDNSPTIIRDSLDDSVDPVITDVSVDPIGTAPETNELGDGSPTIIRDSLDDSVDPVITTIDAGSIGPAPGTEEPVGEIPIEDNITIAEETLVMLEEALAASNNKHDQIADLLTLLQAKFDRMEAEKNRYKEANHKIVGVVAAINRSVRAFKNVMGL